MGFPREVKNIVLINSARHCCVCHRYKGLKIEVHHIIPRSEGGSDNIDNAIPLCLDCHTDAGHYNVKHSKGTKLTKEELIKARDNWFEIVKTHQVESPIEIQDDIHIRYILCKNLDYSREIIKENLDEFPIKKTYLMQNEILQYFKAFDEFFHLYNDENILTWDHPNKSLSGQCYKNVNEYLLKHPDAKLVDTSDYRNPYYSCTRIPLKKELYDNPKISRLIPFLLDIGVEPYECIKCVAYQEKCGSVDEEGVFCEQVIYRPLWTVFLHVMNIGKNGINLKHINGLYNEDSCSFRKYDSITADKNFETRNFKFPSVRILPKESILIPLFLCFAPFDNLKESILNDFTERHLGEQVQTFSLSKISEEIGKFPIIGKFFLPKSIEYLAHNKNITTEIHELDLNRVYSIDSYWMVGSCPHLFYGKENGSIKYVQELFTQSPGNLSIVEFIIPQDVNKLIVAELEDEITIIKNIKINEEIVVKDIILTKGQIMELNVLSTSKVVIAGRYLTYFKPRRINNIKYRNHIIGRFQREYMNN